ncbi:MAG: bifunctional methylenetetrahydrofolate dehydrogenase/methenyltetrahydrofolate cyclohydrolase FolD [Caldicoprobacterales bacterium]|jgi:methylenetetrahydrofolate dehydrogenase (NADP+)/methenyltetrahydrofolate cyclohydrolase|nr:bifunctional methylenetetrahydrofolate dehydrogenase/methenyltetrahydrofolate cyclohydrolase FolD [Clostridiales bacterium]
MSIIIDGKAISKRIRESIKRKVDECKMNGLIPNLSVVLVGEDPASKVYARNKQKACKEVGIKSTVVKLEENTSEQELLEIIYRLNQDNTIHGILVQLPLPNHIDEKRIINAIDLSKDVDGFHPMHSGMLMNGQAILEPCTPKGIIRLIEETKQNIEGKNAVVIGRSNIVGKPVAIMLLQKNATVTIAHSRTENLAKLASTADILVVAIGKPRFIDRNYVKEGAIVIDVGITSVNGALVGDVDFDDVKEKAGYITPVPGGVGPMTITMLLENTLIAAKGAI